MRAAAQLVYDRTRHTIIAGMTRSDRTDNPLVAMATLLVVNPEISVRGKVLAATVSDEVPYYARKNMCARQDLESIGHAGERDPRYFQVEIKRAGLKKFIVNQHKMSNLFVSGK